MKTAVKDEINLDDLTVDISDENLSLDTVEQDRDKKLNKSELKNELNTIIEEYAHSNEKIKELIEIQRHLIDKTDRNIEWLADSNTFKRIWRRITGKTFRIDLQIDQYMNDLNKVGLELFNQLNQKMLIQQQQLVWMQKEIRFIVNEQTQFRQKLKEKLELIIENSHKRFERIESALRDTTKSVLELKKQLTALGVRVDVIEREQQKIKHRLNTIEWKDSIQNKRSGDSNKFKELENHDYSKITTFLSEIDEFIEITNSAPTLTDYEYLEDILGFYGFDKTNNLYAKDIVNLLINQVPDNPTRETMDKIIGNWKKTFGIVDDFIDKDLVTYPISPEKPFSSFTERVIYIINDEVNANRPVTYDSVVDLLNTYRLSDGKEVMDQFLEVICENYKSFDDLRFDWFDISKEYISFKKSLKEINNYENTEAENVSPFDKIVNNPSSFLQSFNLQLKRKREKIKRDNPEVSDQIYGWKKSFPKFFTLSEHEPRSSVRIDCPIEKYGVKLSIHFYCLNQDNFGSKRIRMAYFIPEEEFNHFDFQGAEDFKAAFGHLELNNEIEGDYRKIYFDWFEPDNSFQSIEQMVQTLTDKVINYFTAKTAYTEITSEVDDKIKALPKKFNDAKIVEVEEVEEDLKIKMKCWRFDNLYLWKKNSKQIFETHGAIGEKYRQLGESSSELGFPTSDEMPLKIKVNGANSNARYQLFENGELQYWPEVHGEEVKIKNK